MVSKIRVSTVAAVMVSPFLVAVGVSVAVGGPAAPEADGGDETCTEESEGPSRLRAAFFRDFLIFLGVLYLVAWPDLRKRYSPKSNG